MTPSALKDLAPLRRPTRLHDVILEELGRRIVSGALVPGEQLPHEQELAHTFCVSRSVLRSGLQLLEGKGLIEIRHGSNTRVRPLGLWNLLDADVLRWVSEWTVPLGPAHQTWEGTVLREEGARFAAAIHALAPELHDNPLYTALARTLCAAGYGDAMDEFGRPTDGGRS